MSDQDLSKLAKEIATPVETVINQNWSIEQALTELRKKKLGEKIVYFYAIDADGKLKGVVSTRQLLLTDPSEKIQNIMQTSIVKISSNHTLKDALEMFEQHPLLALPVVDKEGQFLGTIDLQTITHEPVDFLDQRSRMDAFQMIGVTLEERRKIPLWKSYRYRIPWLLCNVFSGLMCAVISRIFELVLSKVLLLAFFIPLVLTLAESASMQSMAQSLQFLRRPRFYWKSVRTRALREWQLVSMIAVSLGILVGALSLLWESGLFSSLTIGVGIIVAVIFSTFFAITVPIFLNRMKLDPKVASGPVVLMIVDMLTTAVYLGLATWWLL